MVTKEERNIEFYLSNHILRDTSLSDLAIATYATLRMIQTKNRKLYYIRGDAIYYYLSGKVTNDLRDIKKFNKALLELDEKKYIKILQNKKDSSFEVDLTALNISKEYYTIVYQDEIRKIINSDEKYRFRLLRYFLCLVSTFTRVAEGKNKATPSVSYISASNLRDMCDLKNIKTVYRYNDVLQDLCLIYVERSNDFVKIDNTVKSIPNTYGRYKDKDIVIKTSEGYTNKYGSKRLSAKNAHSTRSASHKYMWWLKGKEYSYDELKEVYLTLVEFNKKYERIDDSRLKDLTVFSEFDFYVH
ncbi:MAG: hypothetical protein WDK95_13705 [Syntrophorhabdaceae bacterium]